MNKIISITWKTANNYEIECCNHIEKIIEASIGFPIGDEYGYRKVKNITYVSNTPLDDYYLIEFDDNYQLKIFSPHEVFEEIGLML